MKSVLLAVCFTIFSLAGFAQSGKFQLSSHILDISKGAPAAGVPIRLEKMDPAGKSWLVVDQKTTDKNGRVGDFFYRRGSPIRAFTNWFFLPAIISKNSR
jgi:5-hydroxyisourate hydrolase